MNPEMFVDLFISPIGILFGIGLVAVWAPFFKARADADMAKLGSWSWRDMVSNQWYGHSIVIALFGTATVVGSADQLMSVFEQHINGMQSLAMCLMITTILVAFWSFRRHVRPIFAAFWRGLGGK